MYIIKKKIKGREYYYARESKREGKKVISKTIAYLGKIKKEATRKFEQIKKEKNSSQTYPKEKFNKIISKKLELGKMTGKKGKQEDKIEKAEKQKQETTKEKGKKQDKIETKIETKQEQKKITIDELTMFCKRKGFVYNSGEIYGGLAGFWDFGFNGAELKNNIKNNWKKFFIQLRDDMTYIDGSIITHPKTWVASGHVSNFSDVSVTCKKCKKASKVDKADLDKATCSYCKGELDKTSAKDLNLMFTTQVGPIQKESTEAYLRPETAQLIFINFKNIAENYRMKLPFGIAQIGKAYRNEIAPRDFLFRSREFEQMEIEYFIMPGESCLYKISDVSVLIFSAEMQEQDKEAIEMKIKEAFEKKIIKKDWHAYWLANCLLWFKQLGCDLKNFRLRQHNKGELSHYSSDCWDLEYNFPFGWKELTGIADRSNYDLSQHEKFSGEDLKLVVEGKGKILPEVVAEPSFGVERAFLVVLCEAYRFDEKRQNIVLKLHQNLAPYKAAVLPIVKNDEKILKLSREILNELRKEFNISYDESASLGRRYSRNDEIGTPFCITIDNESLKDKQVTIRDRDTTEQVRVKISDLRDILRKIILEDKSILEFGKKVETRVKEN